MLNQTLGTLAAFADLARNSPDRGAYRERMRLFLQAEEALEAWSRNKPEEGAKP